MERHAPRKRAMPGGIQVSTESIIASVTSSENPAFPDPYEYGPVHLFGTQNGLFERHLLYDNVIERTAADSRDRFEAFARSVRDILSQRWVSTESTYERLNPKRIYYLSMEFLLPEYSVSLAERLIAASDVSNQISTAGFEASGTSNVKFMMNGALTVGTRDGGTIEMAEEAGEDNFFLFGLTAEQVAGSRGWYNPHWHYENEPETRAALDLIFSDHFSRGEPGVFAPLRDTLLTGGDYYMHLADLTSYIQAHERLGELYADPDAWTRKAILNVAGSGKFSSDRTIAEYAAGIWNVEPCPVT